MLRPIDNWFLQQEEPAKVVLNFCGYIYLTLDKSITEEWKYGLPFYCYQWKNVLLSVGT